MLKWIRGRCSKFSEQLDIIDYIGKYFLMEKEAVLLMPKIYFYAAQISWSNIFPGKS